MNILKWLFNPEWFTFSFGGGGGGTTSTGTTYTSNIPEYLQPYVEKMVGSTEKQVYEGEGFRPYQSYAQYDQARGGTGETVAGFTPLQAQSMQGIQNYQLPQQGRYGSQMAGMAGLGSMQAGNQYARQATNPYATQAYMSPYMENAVAPQMREAARQSAIQGQANQAQAVQQGAFGGGRSAIVEAERQRNLGQQQADIYGKGTQTAFEQAQQAQQFGANLNLQGLGQGLQGAQALGALGQQQYGQEMGLLSQQQGIGKQQQEFEQNRLNQIVQDYATSQQYPLMQLGVLSNMLRGLPMQSSSTQMYQAQPSMASQIAGGLGTGLELYKSANQAFGGKKDGGVIKMAGGGIATGVSPAKLPSMLRKLSDGQLEEKDKDQSTDPATGEDVDAELARRGALRSGIKPMAAGGAIAFAEGEEVKDEEKTKKGIRERILEQSPTTPVLQSTPVSEGIVAEPKASMDTGIQEGNRGLANLAVTEEAPKPAVGPTREDMYAAQEKLLTDQAAAEKLKSERTVNQVIAAQNEERRQAGFIDPAIAEGKTIDERKAKIAGDTREAAQDRLTQFLINWGKTPGPALNGFINAGGSLIEANIEDKKLRKKLLDDLDDARLGVNRGVYERRLGNEKEARAEISKAGEQYYAINEKILQHKEKVYLKQLDLENKLAQMELKGEIAALKGANKSAIIQQVEVKARALVQKYVRELTANTMTIAQIEDMALNQVLALQPTVTSTAMTIPSRETAAGAAASQADTAAERSKSDAKAKEVLRNKEVDAEVDKLAFDRRDEIKPLLNKAKDKTEKAQIKKDFNTKLRTEVEARMPKIAGDAPAPAPNPALTPNADGSFNYTRPRN